MAQAFFGGSCPPGFRPVGVRQGVGGRLETICEPVVQTATKPATGNGLNIPGIGTGGGGAPAFVPCPDGTLRRVPSPGFGGGGARKKPEFRPVVFVTSQTSPFPKPAPSSFGQAIPEGRPY